MTLRRRNGTGTPAAGKQLSAGKQHTAGGKPSELQQRVDRARAARDRVLDRRTTAGTPGAFKPVWKALRQAHRMIRDAGGSPASREAARRLVARAAVNAGLKGPDQHVLRNLVGRDDFATRSFAHTRADIYRRLAGGYTPEEAARRDQRDEVRTRIEREDAAYRGGLHAADRHYRSHITSAGHRLYPAEKLDAAMAIADRTGILPSAAQPYLTALARRVNAAVLRSRHRPEGAKGTAPSEQDRKALLAGYRYARRLFALGRKNPAVWRSLSAHWRALATGVAQRERGGLAGTDDQRVAVMLRAGGQVASRELRQAYENWRDAMGYIPLASETVAIAETVSLLRKAKAAQAEGNEKQALNYTVAAVATAANVVPIDGLIKIVPGYKQVVGWAVKTYGGPAIMAMAKKYLDAKRRVRGRVKSRRRDAPGSGDMPPRRPVPQANGGPETKDFFTKPSMSLGHRKIDDNMTFHAGGPGYGTADPPTGGVKGHFRQHPGQQKTEKSPFANTLPRYIESYRLQAIWNLKNGHRFKYTHEGQEKVGAATYLGSRAFEDGTVTHYFLFSSMDKDAKGIFTHFIMESRDLAKLSSTIRLTPRPMNAR